MKKDSIVWQLAKRYARRKYVNSIPVCLSDDGKTVTMQSLIRGNTWNYTQSDLKLLLGVK